MAGLSKALEAISKLGVVLVVGGVTVNTTLYNVAAGHRAVIYDRFRGVKEEVIGEGTHFIIPWVQRPIIFDCRTKPRVISTVTGTKDLQNVNITLRILHRPRSVALPRIYKELGVDYDDRVLPSIGNEVLKSIVAQFDASELITQRELVSQRVRQALLKRSSEFDIVLDDISLTHLTFGREFAQAVELKQVEQQKAERARFVVEKAEQEQLAEIIRAEGDSEAARLISQSLAENGPGLVELRKIDAAVDISQTLSRSRNVAYLPSTGGNLLLNIGGVGA